MASASTHAASHRRVLRALVRDYLGAALAIDYRELTRRQPAPFASIGYGAGGIVFALLRAGMIDEAARWLDGARRGARGRRAFLDGRIPPRFVASSVSDGPAGLDYLGARVAHLLGDRRARARHLGRFVAHARGGPRPAEVLHGRAGFLIAALDLERQLGDERARDVADELAASLLDPRWELPTTAFAHGDAGVLHALLEWAHVRGRALPGEVVARLDQVAAPRAVPAPLAIGWCNGAAGDLLLWAKAFRHDRDPRHLDRAEAHARACRPTGEVDASLCCGLGGAAYALLALERVAPGRGAADAALALGARAAGHLCSAYPNAVLRGYPGLVCLAIDLLGGGGGFPLVEVEASR
jgi:hypothetical protein